MVQLRLPKGSEVKKGKAWPEPRAADGKRPQRTKRLKIYRFDPEQDETPRLDTYIVDLETCGAERQRFELLLDELLGLKDRLRLVRTAS